MDSAQAAIIGLHYLQKESLKEAVIHEFDTQDEFKKRNALGDSSLSVVRYSSDVGKHGDIGRSKFDILEAIKGGELDAGSIGSSTWIGIMQEGNYSDIESFWSGPKYCHCNFSVLLDFDIKLGESFTEMILSQNARKDNPIIAKMMQMEELNTWIKAGESELRGYDSVYQAMREQNLLRNNL